MKTLLLAATLSLPAVLAYAQAAGPGYEITGQDARLTQQWVFLNGRSRELAYSDSAQADATGRFTLRGRVPEPEVYLLRVGREKASVPLPLTGNERLEVKLKPVKGPDNGPDILLLRPTGPEPPALALFGQANKYFLLQFKAVPPDDKQLRAFKNLLRANVHSFLAPGLTYQYLRRQDSQTGFIDSLTTIYQREQPTSRALPKLRELLTTGPTLAVGRLAPDLRLLNDAGQPVALSSLRGKYVLLDFWASWCKPCRLENPNVRAAYEKFKGRGVGFTVYAVSIDEDAAKWRRALTEDALPWTQVLEPGGWKGASARQYLVESIPANWLLDPEGRIVATNLRGPALAETLTKYLP